MSASLAGSPLNNEGCSKRWRCNARGHPMLAVCAGRDARCPSKISKTTTHFLAMRILVWRLGSSMNFSDRSHRCHSILHSSGQAAPWSSAFPCSSTQTASPRRPSDVSTHPTRHQWASNQRDLPDFRQTVMRSQKCVRLRRVGIGDRSPMFHRFQTKPK